MDELISIITTSYNYADYISETIESVINQTYKNWELIVIDDASSDNSVEIIDRYAKNDSRIKLIINNKNLGLAKSIQKALNYTNGNWIAFLESDDIFTPESLEEKVKAISIGADIIYTDVEPFQDEVEVQKCYKYLSDVKKLFIKTDKSGFIDNFKNTITKVNIIPTFSVVMLRKNLLESCDYNSISKASLDYYLWAQLSSYKIYYINKKLTKWRMHKNSYINTYKFSWFKNYKFYISLYYQTIKNKPFYIRYLLLLNYMRTRIIYLKINRSGIKLNIGNNKFIFEKSFNKEKI